MNPTSLQSALNTSAYVVFYEMLKSSRNQIDNQTTISKSDSTVDINANSDTIATDPVPISDVSEGQVIDDIRTDVTVTPTLVSRDNMTAVSPGPAGLDKKIMERLRSNNITLTPQRVPESQPGPSQMSTLSPGGDNVMVTPVTSSSNLPSLLITPTQKKSKISVKPVIKPPATVEQSLEVIDTDVPVTRDSDVSHVSRVAVDTTGQGTPKYERPGPQTSVVINNSTIPTSSSSITNGNFGIVTLRRKSSVISPDVIRSSRPYLQYHGAMKNSVKTQTPMSLFGLNVHETKRYYTKRYQSVLIYPNNYISY